MKVFVLFSFVLNFYITLASHQGVEDGILSFFPPSSDDLIPNLETLEAIDISTSENVLSSSFSSPNPPIWLEGYWIVGPFPAAQRTWLQDPIGAYGSIFNVTTPYDSSECKINDIYPSSLNSSSGYIGWSYYETDIQSKYGDVSVSYNDLDWTSLSIAFGWSSWLWQSWAVTEFEVADSGTSLYYVQCLGVRDFYIDDQLHHYLGDYYSYGYGGNAIRLDAGVHRLYVHLSSSVRKFQSPSISFSCHLKPLPPSNKLLVHSFTGSTFIDGQLSSPYASLGLMVTDDDYTASLNVTPLPDSSPVPFTVAIVGPILTKLPPGQSLNLGLIFHTEKPLVSCEDTVFHFLLTARSLDGKISQEVEVSAPFTCNEESPFEEMKKEKEKEKEGNSNRNGAYLINYPDVDGTIQYAVVRPPKCRSCCKSSLYGCPILMATHGAGVSAGSAAWFNSFQRQEEAWTILPNGRRPWANDWEGISRSTMDYAIDYLAEELPGVPESLRLGYTADSRSILYAGHSMGGHGCISAATHDSGRALAAACGAAFIKIELYVPYYLSPILSAIDPRDRSVLMASISDADTDLYVDNLENLPIWLRWGEKDDNVPPFHSATLSRILHELHGKPELDHVSIIVDEGKGHWYSGFFSDAKAQDFFSHHLVQQSSVKEYFESSQKRKQSHWRIETASPIDFLGQGCVRIVQFEEPWHLAEMEIDEEVNRETGEVSWRVHTNNVRRFAFDPTAGSRYCIIPDKVYINTMAEPIRLEASDTWPLTHIVLISTLDDPLDDDWQKITDNGSWQLLERGPTSYGPLRQVFTQKGGFIIVYPTFPEEPERTQHYLELAVHMSLEWFLFSNGAPKVLPDYDWTDDHKTVAIIIGDPSINRVAGQLLDSAVSQFAAPAFDRSLPESKVSKLLSAVAPTPSDPVRSNSLLFDLPCAQQKLCVIVTGSTDSDICVAIHNYFPYRPGIVTADYLLLDNTSGTGDVVLEAGFWSNDWSE